MEPTPKEKASSPARLLFWVLPSLLSLAATLWVIFVAFRWVRGDECRSLLETHTSSALHASMEFDPITLRWLGISSRGAKATGAEGGILKALRAEGLSANIRPSSLLKGFWDVELISIEKLRLHFGSSAGVVPPLPPASTGSKMPRWVPSRAVVRFVHGRKTDIFIELPAGRSFLLEGSRLEGHPGETKSTIRLFGGKVTADRYPDLFLTLGSADWILTDDKADLLRADLSSPHGGSISLSGTFRAGSGSSGLFATWSDLPARVLLPRLADHLSGTFSGEARSSWQGDGSREAAGVIRSGDLVLSDVPSLERLAVWTGLPGFRNLRITRFESRFSMRNGVTHWEDFLIEAPGFLKCTGRAETTDNGRLSGTFRFGITARIVSMIPFARELLGLEESEGYVWTREPVTVGGTLSRPEEDFTPRIAMIMATGAEGAVRNGIRAGLDLLGIRPDHSVDERKSSAPTANGPAGNPEKTGKQILDAVEGFLR